MGCLILVFSDYVYSYSYRITLHYNLKSHGTRGVLGHRPLDRGKTGSPCCPVQGDGLLGLDRGPGLSLTKRRVSLALARLGIGLAPARLGIGLAPAQPLQGSSGARPLTQELDKHLLPQILVTPRGNIPRDGLIGLDN